MFQTSDDVVNMTVEHYGTGILIVNQYEDDPKRRVAIVLNRKQVKMLRKELKRLI